MATFTENYSLIKPGEADWNENMDTPDAALAENETLVLMERLADGTNSGCEDVAYSLSTTGLTISHDTTYASRLKFAFWLIEFN